MTCNKPDIEKISNEEFERKLAAKRKKQMQEMLTANKTQEERLTIPKESGLGADVKLNAMFERKGELDLIKEQRKARKRKYFREYRKARRQQETAEQTAVRRAKNNELYKRRCLKKQIESTSRGEVEQKPVGERQQNVIRGIKINDEILQKIREKHQQYRKLRQLRMTPEQKEAHRIKTKEQNRLNQERLNREMPEKAAAIRARISEMRKRRRDLEQQSEKKRKSEYMKEYRKKIRMTETPEEKEARLVKDRETLRIRRQKRRDLKNLLDTKTQNFNIKSIHEIKEQSNNNKAKHYTGLTIDQRQQDILKRLELLSQYREQIFKICTKEHTKGCFRKENECNSFLYKKEREIEHSEKINAACRASSPRRPSVKASLQHVSLSPHIKIENEVFQETRLQTISKFKEDSQLDESWSLCELPGINISTDNTFESDSIMQNVFSNKKNISSFVKDVFYCMRATLDLKAMQDRYYIYGEILANKIRNCDKSDKEIYIAKQLIDIVIDNLNLDDSISEENSKISTIENVQYIDFKTEPMV